MLEKRLIVLLFHFVVDAWKVDMLAQSLCYADIMADVSFRPEFWFEWSLLNGLCQTVGIS